MSKHASDLFRDAIPLFTTLSDPARQDIILMLATEESLSVNEIAERSRLSRPAVSHHLKIMREQQLLRVEQLGTQRLYSLSLESGIRQLKELITVVESTCLHER